MSDAPPYQRCAICKEQIFMFVSPMAIRQHNPLTFRIAWMHFYCCVDAFDEIADMPAKNREYENRLEEYTMKFD